MEFGATIFIHFILYIGIEVGFQLMQSPRQFNESDAPFVLCVELVAGQLERSASLAYSTVEISEEGQFE